MGDDGIFRRPAVPQPVRIRRDVHKLPPDDKTLFWYERAIRRMKPLGLDKPLGLRYQASIHDYPSSRLSLVDRRAIDPRALPGDVVAPNGDQFIRQCEHGGWFFLPWHRMYLHFFEKIVAKHVVAEGGPANWALPYWNYSASVASARLPRAFFDPANESTNALFIPERSPDANQGRSFLAPAEVALDRLNDRPFGINLPPALGFGVGGGLFRNHSGSAAGGLERLPHNTVHSTLGSGGFMSGFVTAPLDPLFWLHHSNIDRLWEVWIQRQKARGNLDRNPIPGKPPPANWQENTFDFRDETEQPVLPMKVSSVLDTRVAPLSYEYEDTSDPLTGTP